MWTVVGLILLLIAGCAAYALLNYIIGIPVKRSLIAIAIYIVFAIIINLVGEQCHDMLYFLLGFIICIVTYDGGTYGNKR